eukprot:11130549-Heterocapsa_arctica.AAC.1
MGGEGRKGGHGAAGYAARQETWEQGNPGGGARREGRGRRRGGPKGAGGRGGGQGWGGGVG